MKGFSKDSDVSTSPKTYTTKTGRSLSAKEVDRIADEAATMEIDVVALRTRRRGRPSIGNQPGEVVPVRMPSELRADLREVAAAKGMTVSALVREAVNVHLEAHSDTRVHAAPDTSSKFDVVMNRCVEQMEQQRISVDRLLLEEIGQSLGPSLYRRDALLVAAAQKSELERIKQSYLVGKLGCDKDDPSLDRAINKAIARIGKSRRNKMRPVFYYLLVKELGMESAYRSGAIP